MWSTPVERIIWRSSLSRFAAQRLVLSAGRGAAGVSMVTISPVSASSSSIRPTFGQLALPRVGDRDGDQVVPAGGDAQPLLVAGAEEVRDQEHHRPAPRDPAEEIERAGDVGARLPGLEVAAASRIRRSTWETPFFGGMYCSTSSVKTISPTLSLFLMAEKASSAQSSAATSFLSLLAAAEGARGREVHQEHHRQLALLDVALDVRVARCAP